MLCVFPKDGCEKSLTISEGPLFSVQGVGWVRYDPSTYTIRIRTRVLSCSQILQGRLQSYPSPRGLDRLEMCFDQSNGVQLNLRISYTH